MDQWTNINSWDAFKKLLPENKVVTIFDSVTCDARPLTHQVMGQLVKTGRSLCLLSCETPLTEFISVGRRLGYDLGLLAIQNKFTAIDFSSSTSNNRNYRSLDILQPDIFESILQVVDDLRQKMGTNIVLVIDGLHKFRLLGHQVFEIMRLIVALEEMCSSALVLRTPIHDRILAQWLTRRSAIICINRAPSSGALRSLHGHIIVSSGGRTTLHKPQKTAVALFKCSDTSILVQPKEVSVLDEPQTILSRIRQE